MLTTPQLRGMMYRVYDLTTSLTGSATTYSTLIVAMQALTTANFSVSTTGQIQSTSANGRSVSFASTSEGSSPQDYAEGASYLRDLYVDGKAAIIAGGIASPTDAQIHTEMMFRLVAVKKTTSSFRDLRSYA